MGTAGQTGMGPVPKRKDERRRRNKTTDTGLSNEVQAVQVFHEDMEDVSLVHAPAPNPQWHPIAMMLYEGARRSAIREFFEPSDWAALFVLLETVSQHMHPQPVVIQNGKDAGQVVMVQQPMSGALLGSVMTALNNLMFTEGARRRLRIEVERVAGSAAKRQQPTAPTGDNVIQMRHERLGS